MDMSQDTNKFQVDRADEQLIHWLLHESNVTRYRISKDTGITQSTLSRLYNGITNIERMRLGHAITLTMYAKQIKEELAQNQK